MNRDSITNGLFDVLADVVLVIDTDGRIQFANSACSKILGYEPAELVGELVEKLVPAEIAGHDRLRQTYLEGGGERGMNSGLDLDVVRSDGQKIPVDITLSPFDHGGKRFVAVAIRDMRGREWRSDILRLQSTALESAANGIVITTREGIITWANPAASRMTGYPVEELVGQNPRILKSGRHPPELYEELWETVLRGDVWSGTFVNRRKNGTHYHEEMTIAPVVGDDGEITHFVAIKQDISVRVGLEEELQRLAQVDSLTGCANRHRLLEVAESEISRARRNEYPISVILFDLDRFKSVNDRFGHATGDTSLLPGGKIATVSAGVVEVERSNPDIHSALQAADKALYRAKAEGRNRVVRGS